MSEPPDKTVERLLSVLEERGWSLRELGRQAEMVPEHAVKLKERGLARAGAELVLRIADALGVNVRWLLTGEGPKDRADTPPANELRVEYDERYPNREKAIAALEGANLEPETKPTARTYAWASNVDPPVRVWIERILQLDNEIRWEKSASPAEREAKRATNQRVDKVITDKADATQKAAVERVKGQLPKNVTYGAEDLPPAPPKWKGGKPPKSAT